MASRIDEIFAALAQVPVAFNNAVVTTFNIDELPESVDNRHTPCRLLIPLGTRAEARSITPITINGEVATIAWRATDLFLMKPVGLTGGIAAEAPNLVAYMQAYVNAMQMVGFRLLSSAQIENMAFEPTITPFPTSGNTQFFAIEVSLTIKEICQ